MRHILVVGKNSYIGESLKQWLELHPQEYIVETICAKSEAWKQADFSRFDTVVDVAGIAHINNITKGMKSTFYSVNRDLSIAIAMRAKKQGVKQFVFFSSMNVYGDYCNRITDRNETNPTSFYGDSKLQGDTGVRNLSDSGFKVAVLRPPFVYGKGCTGNYRIISAIAKKTPVFPVYGNRKSMIYISNLCELVRLIIDERAEGIFTPQNKELVSTADLVRKIAECNNKRIWFTRLFNWAIKPAVKLTKTFRRAFSDDCYELQLSDYWNFSYCVVDFNESIRKTEC